MNTKLEKLGARELTLHVRRRSLAVAIALAEQAAGAAIMDGPAVEELGAITRQQVEFDALGTAIGAIRRQRTEAILGGFREEAESLRALIRTKESELAGHEKKVASLLTQLSQLEGVTVTASEYLHGELNPKSLFLSREIVELRRRGDQLASRQVPAAGVVDLEAVTSNDQVLAAVLEHPSEIPAADAIESWLQACEGTSLRPFGELPRRVRLQWRAGVVDLEASYVYVGALAAKHSASLGYSFSMAWTPEQRAAAEAAAPRADRYDVASGKFRAKVAA